MCVGFRWKYITCCESCIPGVINSSLRGAGTCNQVLPREMVRSGAEVCKAGTKGFMLLYQKKR